jgi:hypothetical protein
MLVDELQDGVMLDPALSGDGGARAGGNSFPVHQIDDRRFE